MSSSPTTRPLTLSTTASHFLAGILHHLPALLPFTAPSVNSYSRLAPSCWSGAYQIWGWDNREAPLRMACPDGLPDNLNAEYKAFDGSTNPYVGLTALICAGMLGECKGHASAMDNHITLALTGSPES